MMEILANLPSRTTMLSQDLPEGRSPSNFLGLQQGRSQGFIGGGGKLGNINLSIKTFLQNFKIEKNCIANFSKCFTNSLLILALFLESFASF